MKRVCSWILSLALLAGTLSTPALAELVPAESAPPPVEQTEQPPAESAPQVSLLTLAPGEVVGGQCGDNLTWELAEDTGTLTISGTGAMWDYHSSGERSNAPWCAYATQLRRLVIADGVTTIGAWAFYYCGDLTGALTIPDGVTTIGQRAFNHCSGLTGNLTLPSSLTTIGEAALQGCGGLTGNLTLPSDLTAIGEAAFNGCSGLTGALTLPSGVTTIDGWAFAYCGGLTGNLAIPGGVTTIGDMHLQVAVALQAILHFPAE
ncbi:MAG: leucine-rich repeat domain-containing protein [Oscillospiraceae bacterium]